MLDEMESYSIWIKQLKDKIERAQLRASLSVNTQLILLYWEIGESIVQKQIENQWGSKIVEKMAKDLKMGMSETNGFSRSNLFAMRKFYLFYKDSHLALISENELVQQAVGQLRKESILYGIPWGHHVLILNKCVTIEQAEFYLAQTIKSNWSRNILSIQLTSNLFDRQGKSQNNFKLTLPKNQSDLANETLKDPYQFDFLTLEKNIQELELEKNLTENITKFLLELGKGFAFVGRQYPIIVGKKERKIDLLFYHTRMHCYVVVDLKMGEFEPEFVGKMNFYLSAIDDLLKTDEDKPSIGIILCKSKDSIDVEYSLRGINKPLGISEFTYNELTEKLKENMPTVSELENELFGKK
jgi:predicted nuclease of restriction endonuclease-like (RecB) superfamily